MEPIGKITTSESCASFILDDVKQISKVTKQLPYSTIDGKGIKRNHQGCVSMTIVYKPDARPGLKETNTETLYFDETQSTSLAYTQALELQSWVYIRNTFNIGGN